MKKHLKRIVPFLLTIGIVAAIGWYLMVYDRDFTRDILLEQARYHDTEGNDKIASFFYNLAYEHSGQDDSVAIELAQQYIADGNYTKAEQTLTNAIADGGTSGLYVALCKVFVQQDKLQDAVAMLNNIADPVIKAELDALRPAAPTASPAPGFYSQYISVELSSSDGVLYCTSNGEYPSTEDAPYSEPIPLPAGETKLYAVNVAENGLVSPMTVLGYTIGGVIEEAKFTDPAMEAAIRESLGVGADVSLLTNELWNITNFTIPKDATSYEDLSLIPYVEVLTIEEMQLESLSPLSHLTHLTELHMTGCRFPSEDLAIIAALPKLNKLTLSQCSLSTITPLSAATGLTHLDLSNNTLRNLEPLSNMVTLVQIDLQHNAVTSVEALSKLSNLEKLDVSYNSLVDLSPLSTCLNLSWLGASNNSISELSGLNYLPGLSYLDLSSNTLTNISLLGECVKLKELNISNNDLTEISSLSAITCLETLNFSYNEVEELPTWPDGSALASIDGSYNKLKNINALKNMENLTYVYMDYNELTSIDAIAGCYHLVLVNVYGNEIEDVSALTKHDIIVNYDPTN